MFHYNKNHHVRGKQGKEDLHHQEGLPESPSGPHPAANSGWGS